MSAPRRHRARPTLATLGRELLACLDYDPPRRRVHAAPRVAS